MVARCAASASTASSAGVGIPVSRPISCTTVTSGSISIGRPRSRSCSIEVLWAPTLRAASIRRTTSTRNLTPKVSAIAWLSSMIAFDNARVAGSEQITSSVAQVSALIGLRQTLPHSFSQISARLLDIGCAPARRLAERKALAVDMADHAGRLDLGRRIDDAADGALRAE